MEKSEATHVAVGSAALGVGGVALSIMIPLAAAAKPHPWTATWFLVPSCVAGVLGLSGFYLLLAVFTGWPLPQTASDRAASRFQNELGALVFRGQELDSLRVESEEEFEAFQDVYWIWVDDGKAWLERRVSASKAHEFENPRGSAAKVLGSYSNEHGQFRLHLSWQLEILRDVAVRAGS